MRNHIDDIDILESILRLQTQLSALNSPIIAVSGGIDSMLLAYIAQKTLQGKVIMAHALSAAVPNDDTLRVREYAKRYSWDLREVTAGEIEDTRYVNNPVNRCYFCKTHLYKTLAKLGEGRVLSGTNLDDLVDYRPGLIAAKEQKVLHPYVDATINKSMIRAIANHFNLTDLRDLPASPCLASRIETGIKISTQQLNLIGHAESWVKNHYAGETIRFRIRQKQAVLELDDGIVSSLTVEKRQQLEQHLLNLLAQANLHLGLRIEPYKRGSAFMGEKSL